MATAILDVRALPTAPSPRRIIRVASEPARSQLSFQPQDSQNAVPHEDPLIAQLGRLASQHHHSEYNRLKFGPAGSPLIYVPYSAQMPDHYREMRAHQTRCAEHRAWWLHGRSPVRTCSAKPCLGKSLEGELKPQLGFVPSSDVREQLSAAISSSILLPHTRVDRRVTAPTPQPHWQTSETHPIVISTIIPPELLHTISSHLRRSSEHYPTIFDMSPAYSLHRLINAPPALAITQDTDLYPPSTSSIPPPRPSSTAQSFAKSLRLSGLFWVHPTVKRALGAAEMPHQVSKKRSRPASMIAPSPSLMPEVIVNTPHKPKYQRNLSSPAPSDIIPKIEVHQRIGQAPQLPMLPPTDAFMDLSIPAVPSIPAAANTKLLGNLYMSSCPGKKVRLDGPVRGRNTVCRDLRSDLLRIKNVGVTCIICCLDDSELLSLGVSWKDYARTADELDIDILRIPIPEGLAPLDAASLDSHLTKVIESYTLRGSAVLVHCRGGVGRAGIIACCWLLKLGLCGWKDSQAELSPIPVRASEHVPVSDATFSLVDRLISVVRRRRSPKAIETYEQVKFLVDFVEYLERKSSFGMPLSKSLSSAMNLFKDWDMDLQ